MARPKDWGWESRESNKERKRRRWKEIQRSSEHSYVTCKKLQTLLDFFRRIKEGEKGEPRPEFGELLKITIS